MIKKYLLIAAGVISLNLGIIGIFVPILPTTPFILLAAACFMKSSNSLYQWLTNHKYFGKYIENYIKYKAVTLKSKIISIVILWIVILISVIIVKIIWLKILLVIIAIGVTIHLLKLKIMRKDIKKENENK